MADSEDIAASSKGASLPETLNLIANLPNWTVVKCCTRYGRMLDAHRLAGISLDGQCKTVPGCRGMRYVMGIGAWERRCLAMCQQCADTFVPVGPFDIAFVRHVDEDASVRRSFGLFW